MYQSTSTHYRSPQKYSKVTGSQLPTAVKSYYGEGSPTHFTLSRSLRSSSRFGPQLREVKDTINNIIDGVVEKKQNANYGVEKVKEVNNEVIGVFSENNYEIQTPKRNKMFSEEYQYYSPSHKGFQETDIDSENIELKKALNGKIKENNNLMKAISHLRSENDSLRMRSPSKFSQDIPINIFSELQALKRQNQELRQNTIRLLQKNNKNFY